MSSAAAQQRSQSNHVRGFWIGCAMIVAGADKD
jgi:hypothetical protein